MVCLTICVTMYMWPIKASFLPFFLLCCMFVNYTLNPVSV